MYKALYRILIPKKFKDIIGQELIIKILKNAVIYNKIFHVYLFYGPRGTGKTSVAKILARVINCKNVIDGEPCNCCEFCKLFINDKLNDVIEIDAASHNGVEEIRNICNKIKYLPMYTKNKIYIIDEIHMLSNSSFNVLLKILENPPKNVYFIFATTDFEKIPLTIISRVQCLNFNYIDIKVIINYIISILKNMKIYYELEAIIIIAEASNGCLRDALNILDKVIIFNNNKINKNDVIKVVGKFTFIILDYYVKLCFKNEINIIMIFKFLNDIIKTEKQINDFILELLLYFKNLLFYKEYKVNINNEIKYLNLFFKKLVLNISYEINIEIINMLFEFQKKILYSNSLISSFCCLEIITINIIKIFKKIKKKNIDNNYKKNINFFIYNNNINYEIYKILNNATKEDLILIKKKWEKLFINKEKYKIYNIKLIAADINNLIIIFLDYYIIKKFLKYYKIYIIEKFNKIINKLNIFCLTKKEWINIRNFFINKYNKNNGINNFINYNKEKFIYKFSLLSKIQKEELLEDKIINKMVKFFNENLIYIIND